MENLDQLSLLIGEFRAYKEQDAKDKQLIRDDIKGLKDDIVGRVERLEARCEEQMSEIEGLKKSRAVFRIAAYGYYLIGAGALGLLIYHVAK